MLARLLLAGSLVSLGTTSVVAQDVAELRAPATPDGGTAATSPALSDQCRALVAELGASDFAGRESASQGLMDLGPAAYDVLQQEYHATDDYEIRLRIQEIVRSIYFQAQLLGKLGFLGVSLDTVGAADPRVPEGHTAILVHQVVEHTAADRAGLRRDDLIVSVDGQPLEGIISRDEFSLMIREAGPGTPLTLGVYRGPRLFTVEVVLGQRPVEHYFSQYDTTYIEMLFKTEERFLHWWDRRFGRAWESDDGDSPPVDDGPEAGETPRPAKPHVP